MTTAVALGSSVPAVFGSRRRSRAGGRARYSASRRVASVTRSGAEDLTRPAVSRRQCCAGVHSPHRRGAGPGVGVQGSRPVQFLLAHTPSVLFGALGDREHRRSMLFVLFLLLPRRRRHGPARARLIPSSRRQGAPPPHLQAVTRAVVFGTLVTALAQGTLIGVAFWITGCRRRSSSGCSADGPRSSRSSARRSSGAGVADLLRPGRGLEVDLHARVGGRRRSRRQLPAPALVSGGAESGP
jgi:hypothetical protein